MKVCGCTIPYEDCCGRRERSGAYPGPAYSPWTYTPGRIDLPIDYDRLADEIAKRLKEKQP